MAQNHNKTGTLRLEGHGERGKQDRDEVCRRVEKWLESKYRMTGEEEEKDEVAGEDRVTCLSPDMIGP